MGDTECKDLLRLEDRGHNERRLLYSTAIEDIRYSKQQQWRIIHLTLLAIAALGYIHRSTDVFLLAFLWAQ